MKKVQTLAEWGLLPSKLAKCKIPICTSCMFGKAIRKPWRTKPTKAYKPTTPAAPGQWDSSPNYEESLQRFGQGGNSICRPILGTELHTPTKEHRSYRDGRSQSRLRSILLTTRHPNRPLPFGQRNLCRHVIHEGRRSIRPSHIILWRERTLAEWSSRATHTHTTRNCSHHANTRKSSMADRNHQQFMAICLMHGKRYAQYHSRYERPTIPIRGLHWKPSPAQSTPLATFWMPRIRIRQKTCRRPAN
jgi:hypothetical protein